MSDSALYPRMLEVALEEARTGLAEGGIPIGAALFTRTGDLVSRGHNRRVQQGDPSVHGETDAFRRAGRQSSYRNLIMVTTLAPCWYCSGLVRQFRIGTLVVGESRTFPAASTGCAKTASKSSTWTAANAANSSRVTSPSTPKSGTRISAKSSPGTEPKIPQ